MEILPISLVIATYNRENELDSTLTQIYTHFKIAEIIIINNASKDGTARLVESKYPSCKLVNLEKNNGVPAFNLGAQMASQPIIFFLDDDAVPAENTLRLILSKFNENTSVQVVACNIYDNTGTSITENWTLNPICFWGCGVGLRKSLSEKCSYLYDSRLFLHGTEMDLAIRVYSQGGTILYCKEAIIYHRFSNENRSDAKRIFFLVQSAFIFAIKHLPVRYLLIALPRHLTFLLLKSVKNHCLLSWSKGLFIALCEVKLTLQQRKVVSTDLAKRYFSEVWEYEPLLYRLFRLVGGNLSARKDKQTDINQ
jgi:GT2 family glycosyltransferase